MKSLVAVFLIGISWHLTDNAIAQTANSREPQFRICSQNLHNFGDPKEAATHASATAALVERFVTTRCDIIAAQEIFGETTEIARQNFLELRDALNAASTKQFEIILGRTRDRRIRNGYLVRTNLGSIDEVKDFYRYSLPTLQTLGPVRYFPRAPLRLKLTAKNHDGKSKTFFIYAIHFKSQADAWRDPTQTRFEVTRLEMAAAMREIVTADTREHPHSTPIILGDRNSDRVTGSAQVLEGKLSLRDFEKDCQLTKDLTPRCATSPRAGDWTALINEYFAKKGANDGTFRFKKRMEVLDDIVVRTRDLPTFTSNQGNLAVGATGEIGVGSDHKLVYADVTW